MMSIPKTLSPLLSTCYSVSKPLSEALAFLNSYVCFVRVQDVQLKKNQYFSSLAPAKGKLHTNFFGFFNKASLVNTKVLSFR